VFPGVVQHVFDDPVRVDVGEPGAGHAAAGPRAAGDQPPELRVEERHGVVHWLDAGGAGDVEERPHHRGAPVGLDGEHHKLPRAQRIQPLHAQQGQNTVFYKKNDMQNFFVLKKPSIKIEPVRPDAEKKLKKNCAHIQ
jgi:hypothetical protein